MYKCTALGTCCAWLGFAVKSKHRSMDRPNFVLHFICMCEVVGDTLDWNFAPKIGEFLSRMFYVLSYASFKKSSSLRVTGI
jgi:hypothetical protein